MSQITGGRVVFSRTVQARQFEPVRAEVELTFVLMENEELKDTLATVAAQVKAQTLELVGQGLQNTTQGSGTRPGVRRRSYDEE